MLGFSKDDYGTILEGAFNNESLNEMEEIYRNTDRSQLEEWAEKYFAPKKDEGESRWD